MSQSRLKYTIRSDERYYSYINTPDEIFGGIKYAVRHRRPLVQRVDRLINRPPFVQRVDRLTNGPPGYLICNTDSPVNSFTGNDVILIAPYSCHIQQPLF